MHFVSQDDVSQRRVSRLIIRAALLLQSLLAPAHDIQLPDVELQPYVFGELIDYLVTALRRGVYRVVIAAINVR